MGEQLIPDSCVHPPLHVLSRGGLTWLGAAAAAQGASVRTGSSCPSGRRDSRQFCLCLTTPDWESESSGTLRRQNAQFIHVDAENRNNRSWKPSEKRSFRFVRVTLLSPKPHWLKAEPLALEDASFQCERRTNRLAEMRHETPITSTSVSSTASGDHRWWCSFDGPA